MQEHNENRLKPNLSFFFQNAIRSYDWECERTDAKGLAYCFTQLEAIIRPNQSISVQKLSQQEINDLIHALTELTSIKKTAEDFARLQRCYKTLTGIPEFSTIKDGDELRNINSFEYLRNFAGVIPNALYLNSPANHALKTVSLLVNNKYNPNYAYGDLYTAFLLRLEQLIENNDPLVGSLMEPIYFNHNLALERAYHVVKPILDSHNQTSSECEKAVTAFLSVKHKKPINTFSPRDADTLIAKFENKVYAKNVRPQAMSSQTSVRQFSYQTQDDPLEIRMGTQGIFNEFNPEIYNLWTKWDEVSSQNNDTDYSIRHLYFNMLPHDRPKPTDSVVDVLSPNAHNTFTEVLVTKQLHQMPEKEHGVLYVTAPSSRGLLDYNPSGSMSYEALQDKILNVIQGKSKEPIKDFIISDHTRALLSHLSGSCEEDTLRKLLDKTFSYFGFKQGDTLSAEDQQMMSFHFFKYQLVDFYLRTLKPKSFNISCWDGIDRAGVASAYFNLIRSIERGRPISQAEFEKALHGAPVIVKERSINNHIKLLWRVIDYTIKKQHEAKNIPQWLVAWVTKNPLKNTKPSDYTPLEFAFAAASLGMYAYLKECIDNREDSLQNPTALLKIGVAVVLPPVAMLIGLFCLLAKFFQSVLTLKQEEPAQPIGSI